MEIIFLGTSCMIPTKERNTSAMLITHKEENILVDCGEGTQRQLRIAGIRPTCITKILISHWHGDHVLGLPGLLQTLGASEYNGKLRIYGPPGSKDHVDKMMHAFVFNNKVDFEVHDIHKQRFCDGNDLYMEALPLEHTIECLGFSIVEKDRTRINVKKAEKLGIPEGPLMGELQQGKAITLKGRKIEPEEVTYKVKGKKITYIADTALTDNCFKLAEEADLLVCESVYASEHEDKADEYKHLTARQAALIANKANAKQLVLTHFSQRYKNTQDIEEDARVAFDSIICAQDFMRLKI